MAFPSVIRPGQRRDPSGGAGPLRRAAALGGRTPQSACWRPTSPWFCREIHGKIHGKSMENQGKSNGKSVENQWKISGKSVENQWKISGKSVENQWKISGKSVEKHGKVWANPWENHHKSIGQENDDLKQGNLGGVFSGGLSHKKWGGGARKMEGQINHGKCGAGRTFSCSKWHMYHMWAFHIGFPEKGKSGNHKSREIWGAFVWRSRVRCFFRRCFNSIAVHEPGPLGSWPTQMGLQKSSGAVELQQPMITLIGWWFGTFFIFPSGWEFHDPNWRTHIFQRGRTTTNLT